MVNYMVIDAFRKQGVDGVVEYSSSFLSSVDSVEWVRVHVDADERRNTTTLVLLPHRNAYSFIPHTIHRAVSANLPLVWCAPHICTRGKLKQP